ncbi:1460_t:CDS:2 [Dentiscutata erythropus]|uniref:1460_t:CDS:1 n=1 Tax=Dentiscutata erythropus TaxID=1348616 RepID=A0A9N9B1A7_9GLOM|nr:1460_t:CDS:2 [Dentiscutata erythropus]
MLKEIQEELIEFNPFVNTYIQAGNIQASLIYILIYNIHGRDMRQYNLPTTNEVAAICFTDTEMRERDICIYRYDEKFQKISELNGAYDSLQYSLLFPSREYAANKECLEKESQKKLSKNISKDPEISKIEAEESGISKQVSNIDFDNLLKKTSQSKTGLSSFLESATIRNYL